MNELTKVIVCDTCCHCIAHADTIYECTCTLSRFSRDVDFHEIENRKIINQEMVD